MDNKARCKKLKAVRKKVADNLGVDLQQRECTFEGECTGTCPKCKQEEKILNTELLKKKALVGGGSILAALSLTACNGIGTDDALAGDVEIVEPKVELEEDKNIDETCKDQDYEPNSVEDLENNLRNINTRIPNGPEIMGLIEQPPIDERILLEQNDLQDDELAGDVEYVPQSKGEKLLMNISDEMWYLTSDLKDFVTLFKK